MNDFVRRFSFCLTFVLIGAATLRAQTDTAVAGGQGLIVIGRTVIPHAAAPNVRFAKDLSPDKGARVHLFVRNPEGAKSGVRLDAKHGPLFRGKSADDWTTSGDWWWHDIPSAQSGEMIDLLPGALAVLTFDTKGPAWDLGTPLGLAFAAEDKPDAAPITASDPVISLVTFPGSERDARPDSIVAHVATTNATATITAIRLWLPQPGGSPRTFYRQEQFAFMRCFPADGKLGTDDKGGFFVASGPVQLGPAVVEIVYDSKDGKETSMYALVRVRKETFDLGGGYVANDVKGKIPLTWEPYLKTLRRMIINTGQLGLVPGYTDGKGPESLYGKYMLKYGGPLTPTNLYDTDEGVMRLAAADVLGEAAHSGTRPAAPMAAWKRFAPYRGTRIATLFTQIDASAFAAYSGIGDVPAVAAHRISAPAADLWKRYDRFKPRSIGWAAPLETAGEITRALRDTNRPRGVVAWVQGPHDGFSSLDGRNRTMPTPDELRVLAYEALANRVIGLYWYELSLKSIIKGRDLLPEIARVNREARAVGDYIADGDAYKHTRMEKDGRPDWDLASVVAERGAVLFAIDLDYTPDEKTHTFVFNQPRDAHFEYDLPRYARAVGDVFRLDADGIYEVKWTKTAKGVAIDDKVARTALYITADDKGTRRTMQDRLFGFQERQAAIDFDPAVNKEDFLTLKGFPDKK